MRGGGQTDLWRHRPEGKHGTRVRKARGISTASGGTRCEGKPVDLRGVKDLRFHSGNANRPMVKLTLKRDSGLINHQPG